MSKLKFKLEPEINRIKYLVKNLQAQINTECNANGMLHSGQPKARQLKEIPELLETELLSLPKDYNLNKSNIIEILKFIDDQEAELLKSSNEIKVSDYDKNRLLTPAVKVMKQKIINLYIKDKKTRRNDRLKFWIVFGVTTIISVSALLVRVIGLYNKWV